MKYIMVRRVLGKIPNEVVQDVPIIFPDFIIHADMYHMSRRLIGLKCVPISAGEIQLLSVVCFGKSESLDVEARESDGPVIETYDYLRGIVK